VKANWIKTSLVCFTFLAALTGCGSASEKEVSPSTAPAATIVTAVPQPTAASRITGYEFPASIDSASRYMFYLHGKIIEDQGLPAVSPDFGEYEYAAILKRLEDHGFVVISELRPRDTDVDAYARRVVGQIDTLLKAGVPPENITVVGASKGAYIAATVSDLLHEPAMNYVLIGTCHPDTVDEWKSGGFQFHGNVLAIRDVADLEYSGSCEELFQISEGKGLGRHKEIVLHVGTGHGILFKPLDDWILPTVEWASNRQGRVLNPIES
jgi:hypothetical protein